MLREVSQKKKCKSETWIHRKKQELEKEFLKGKYEIFVGFSESSAQRETYSSHYIY